MSELYINKRIDNLGRIVIPKEFRKKLHILENENLDLTLEGEKVIIKKASNDLYNKHLFEIIISVLKKDRKANINIFNINQVYFGDSVLRLTKEEFNDFIAKKKCDFLATKIYPLYPNGILYGGILVEKNENTEFEHDVINCFKNFIEKYLEE